MFGKMNGLIDEIGNRISKEVEKQENDLLNDYKQQMLQTQKNLLELNASKREEDLKKKSEELQASLEKERKRMLKDALEMSNNYKAKKVELTNLLLKNEELDDELGFLDEQIIMAQEQNTRLKDELESLKTEMQKIDPSFKMNDDNLFEVLSYLSPTPAARTFIPADKIPLLVGSPEGGSRKPTMNVVKSLESFANPNKFSYVSSRVDLTSPFNNMPTEQLQDHYNKLQDINKKLVDLNNEVEQLPVHEYEAIFKECIGKVRSNNAMRKKLDSSGMGDLNSSSTRGGGNALSNDPDDYSHFTEYDKRLIIQEYLSNEKVKKMIYDRLFAGNNAPPPAK